MELNGDKKPLSKPGYYKYKETGAIVKLDILPDCGTPLIDAFVQVGFVKIDDSEIEKEIPKVVSQSSDKYTVTVTKKGIKQYRKNGKVISKAEYEKHLGEQPE